ncbi:MAG: histidinol-phosphate transaminase [Clostridiales bacterium]|nr:histidinol-phosphate transaminase [Clostridiales bacterium]
MSKFFSAKYKNLTPYVPGEQPKEREYVKLNTNESPYPPSKKAVRLAEEEARKLLLYPDPDQKVLTSAVAESLGVKANQVIMTNGSDEVLNFAFMAYCDHTHPAVFADITYGFYKVFAEVNNLPYKIIPLNRDFTLSVDDYIKEEGTVFIANPNAPTGIPLPLSEIERLLVSNPERIVVIDEAYVDFGGDSAVKLVDKYQNLLVTQTFSKSRSMAGARLGMGIANEKIISDLNTLKYSLNPYNVNRMTSGAGLGAILDKEYFENNCKEIIATRENTANALKKLGFWMTESKANFLFIKHDKIGGQELYLKLKEKGVLVRHFDSERIKEFNRVTVGSPDQMRTFIKRIEEILEDNQ